MRALHRLRRALRRKEARRGAVVAVAALVLALVALSPDEEDVGAAQPSEASSATTTPRHTTSTAEPTTTTTTAPPTTTTASAPAFAAPDVEVLFAELKVRPEAAGARYDRDRFGSGWIDADGDGCDTRAEVLIEESTTPAQVDPYGCHVVTGDWLSAYDGYTTDSPSELEIDHVVALAEAWRSGADAWSDDRRLAFANDLGDPGALEAVTAATNRAKSDRDPSSWQPPNRDAWCRFAVDWLSVKVRWDLSADQTEVAALQNMLRGCDRTAPAVTTAPPAPLTTAPLTTAAPAPAPGARTGCEPSYPGVCIPPGPPDLDCGDISHRRFQVLPPDPHRFDGEGDGVGCES